MDKKRKNETINQKGFTLIELLAVIVILGLLMALAIPAVTRYITQSRRKTIVTSIDGYVRSVSIAVNDNNYGPMSDGKTLYYIPVSNKSEDSCTSMEKGGLDPFGNWLKAYVVVHYNAEEYSYDYYFTFIDDAGYGMALTKSDEISTNGKNVKNPAPVTLDNIDKQNLNGETIRVLSTDSCHVNTSVVTNEEDSTDVIIYPDGKTKDNVEIGDKITIGSEEFYVIGSDNTKLYLLTKYCIDTTTKTQSATNATIIAFSSGTYWNDNIGEGKKYPGDYDKNTPAPMPYVYDENSKLYTHVNNYAQKLATDNNISLTARLLTYEEAAIVVTLPSIRFISGQPVYWVGSFSGYRNNMYVITFGELKNTFTLKGSFINSNNYNKVGGYIRPVIEINK